MTLPSTLRTYVRSGRPSAFPCSCPSPSLMVLLPLGKKPRGDISQDIAPKAMLMPPQCELTGFGEQMHYPWPMTFSQYLL